MQIVRPLKHLFLDPSDERWVALAASEPQANIFHHPAWTELLAECYGYRPFVVAACDPDDNVCAGLPMMEVSGPLKGRRWVSLPFTDHCAPLCDSAESQDFLAEGLVHLSEARGAPRFESPSRKKYASNRENSY